MPSVRAALPYVPAFLVLTPLLASCGPLLTSNVAKATRTAAPVAVDETLKTFDDPATRQRVAHLMGTPEMQQAIGELGAAASQGAIEDATSTQTQERLSHLTTRLTEAFSRALAQGMAEQQQKLSDSVDTVAANATHAAMNTAATDMRESFGPAVRESVVAALQSPDLRAALDETVSHATTSAAAALHGGEAPERPLLQRLQNLVTFAWLLAVGCAIGVAVLFVHALRGRWRAEARRRAVAEELVSNAIDASKGTPWSNELRNVLTKSLADVVASDRAAGRAQHG